MKWTLQSWIFNIIPDEYFDGIWIVHVIEHLHNGDKVLENLIGKLKVGGFFYVEYPGIKSTKLPSMYGTLNFYDDLSHVRIYSVRELKDLFERKSCKFIEGRYQKEFIFHTYFAI